MDSRTIPSEGEKAKVATFLWEDVMATIEQAGRQSNPTVHRSQEKGLQQLEIVDSKVHAPTGDKTAQSKDGTDTGPRAEKLSAEDAQNAKHTQQTLQNLAVLFTGVPDIESKMLAIQALPNSRREEAVTRLKQEQSDAIRDRQAKLQQEREAGVFGPASKSALNDYIQWMKRAVPDAVLQLDSLLIALPPGCPVELPVDRYQRAINPELYKAMASSGRLKLDLDLDTDKIPSRDQLDKLDGIFDWLAKGQDRIKEAQALEQDRILNSLIDDLGMTRQWQRKSGEDPASWRASAAEMVDLATRTRNYIEAMQSLYKASKDRDFPLALPPGTKLTIEHDGKTFEIADSALNAPNNIKLLREGTLKKVHLELPQDLQQEKLSNEGKVANLRTWLKKYGDKVDQAIGELVRPEPLMYGDQEIRNGKGRFNNEGEFVGIVDPKRFKAGENDKLKDVNLVGYDFDVREITEGPNKGKFEITQTVTAENAPWYAYQNFRSLGVEKLGTMPIKPRIVDADAFLAVRNGNEVQVVKASNLGSFKSAQKFNYIGEKVVSTTMDAAMLVSGSIEVGAAIKGARLSAVGAEAALKLSRVEATRELAKGITRVTVAGAGIFNNAGGPESIKSARSMYFLGDVSQGLLRGGLSALRAARAAETLSGAEKIHQIIHGSKALEGAEALKGIPFIKQAHQGTQWAFKATEAVTSVHISKDLTSQIKQLTSRDRDSAKDAVVQVGDGRGLQAVAKESFDPANKSVLENTKGLLEHYKDLLTAGKNEQTKEKISKILDGTSKSLSLETSDATRKTLVKELTEMLSFSGNEIKALEQADPRSGTDENFRLSAQDLEDLKDPVKRTKFPHSLQAEAIKLLDAKDKDVLDSARIALLFLSRDKSGKIQETPSVAIATPPYKRTITEIVDSGEYATTITREIEIEPRSFDFKLTPAKLVEDLKADLAAKKPSDQALATGDILVRLGAITHQQFGGVLQDVLRSPQTSKAEKLHALTDQFGSRLAAITDGLRHQESIRGTLADSAGKAFGITSKDFVSTLKFVAQNDKDADVRALAAAQFYALEEQEPKRRTAILTAITNLNVSFDTQAKQKGSAVPEGQIANSVKVFLQSELTTNVPDNKQADKVREHKLNAAEALALITSPADTKEQGLISKAISGSVSASNPDLAIRAMEMLLPERINQLSREDHGKVAAEITSLIKLPQSFQMEQKVVRILGNIEPLLRPADRFVKQQLQKQLEEFLVDSPSNKAYAKFFPALRAASIATLGDLGARGSLDVIRAHATAAPALTAGGTVVQAGERDATVRSAAVKSLDRLKDTEIGTYVVDLIDKETDPDVAAKLRTIEFSSKRIQESDREYQQAYQDTLKELIRPYYVKGFGETQSSKWLNENFPLLVLKNYTDRAQDAVNNATSWGFRRTSFPDTIKNEELKAAMSVRDERDDQWKELAKLAHGGDDRAKQARQTLYHIMMYPMVAELGAQGLTLESRGYSNEDNRYTFYNPDFQLQAARILRDCCKAGTPDRDQTMRMIEDGLCNQAGLRPGARMALLEGLQELYKSGDKDVSIPREKAAELYARAIKLEIRREENQNAEFQRQLVDGLYKLQHRQMYPVLEALQNPEDGSRFPAVREKAAETLTALRDSVSTMYFESPEDQSTPPAARAEKLKSALKDSKTAEKTVQQIFNAYKGFQITDQKDPGLPLLELALNNNTERVRLAAARVLIDSGLLDNHPTKARAIGTLAELVVSGTREGYRKDAYEFLGKLELKKPIVLMTGEGIIKIDKTTTGVRVREFTGDQQTGIVYPGGGSMRFRRDTEGHVISVIEDGKESTRRKDNTGYTNQWDYPSRGISWKGDYKFGPDGSYTYDLTSYNERWTRSADGRWKKTAIK